MIAGGRCDLLAGLSAVTNQQCIHELHELFGDAEFIWTRNLRPRQPRAGAVHGEGTEEEVGQRLDRGQLSDTYDKLRNPE